MAHTISRLRAVALRASIRAMISVSSETVQNFLPWRGKARNISGDIGNTLVGAFQSAEAAVGNFGKTDKLDFRDLVTSQLADLAKLGARRFSLGPIANALSSALEGLGGGIFANILHAGGIVGSAVPARMSPAMAFADSQMHSGGRGNGLAHNKPG